MDYRHLGRSGLRVSSLAMGTMTFATQGFLEVTGSTDLEGARRQVAICLDAGINLFDTADYYSTGASEEALGAALKGRREEALIATKVRFPMGEGPNDAGLSRHHVIEACEASLRRLGVDHIDLYQLHEWDGITPVEETLAALDHLVSTGKVRYVGCSNYTGWQMMKALGAADLEGLPRFVSNQVYYSLQERALEHDILPACLDQGVGVLVYSPLAGGLLSGKYRRGVEPPAGSRHLTEWDEPPVHDMEALYDTVEVVLEVAANHDVPPSQVALAWVLSRPGISSVVVGARTEEQLQANLGAAQLSLGEDELARLDEVSRRPLPYPLWHQAKLGADRLSPGERALFAPYL